MDKSTTTRAILKDLGNLPLECDFPLCIGDGKSYAMRDNDMLMLTRAPDSAEEGVDQEDAGPPIAPEGGEGKVVGAVLGSQEQHPHNKGVNV